MQKNRKAKIIAAILALLLISGITAACDTGADGGNAGSGTIKSEGEGTGGVQGGSTSGSGRTTQRAKTENLTEPLDTAEIHFIDVGQGDSTLIIADNEAMLIDCGDNDKGMAVRRYLEKQGIEELEYVIGTHPDADHIGGMDVVFYNFYCDKVIMPDCEADTKTYDDVIQTMRSKNYTVTYPHVGDTYNLGSGSFTIIAPNKEDYSDRNDYSVGIIFDYGSTSFVFTGDAEGAEADIVTNGIDISADVFKAGHHGSSTSSSDAILNAVNPKYAVISCGAGNSYGHPHSETLRRFSKRNIEVYRTDTQGTVIAYTDGISITWSYGKDAAAGSASAQNGTAAAANSGSGESAGSSAPEISETYILNTNTKKYHLPSCRSVKQMSEKNKEESSLSAAEIEALGYEACTNCLQ